MARRVLVLGATSAIASEVARQQARAGHRLCLVGRNREKLEALARDLGDAAVPPLVADFSALAGNEAVVHEAIARLGGLDEALIAHGDLGDQLLSERSFEEAERILTANFTSVVSLLIPLANHLEAQRGGVIGVIGSVAGDRGRPRNYTYGAAKGALAVYLQGLRTRLYPANVKIVTLKLGPVDTPMTVDHQKNALFGTVPAVARDIVAALAAGTPEAYVPFYWAAIMPVVRAAPEALVQRLPFLSGR